MQLSSFSGIFVGWAENKNLLFLRRKVEGRHKLLLDWKVVVTKVTHFFFVCCLFFFGGVVVVLFGDVVEVKLSWCTSQGVKESRSQGTLHPFTNHQPNRFHMLDVSKNSPP